jgi:excisionase family DNA binding protein
MTEPYGFGRILTVEEAAKYLKVCPVTVQRLLKAKKLPGRKVGRSWRLKLAALDKYLDGNAGRRRA